MFSATLVLSLVTLCAAKPLSTASFDHAQQRSPLTLAPLMAPQSGHGLINNSYIVVMKDVAPLLVNNHLNFLEAAHNADPLQAPNSGIKQIYNGHITGYSGHFTTSVIDQIRGMPEVDYVERDQIVRTTNITTQKGAPWGLARISHRSRLGFSTFTKYVHNPQGGEGVDVYVVDTGININHTEFEGRASWGKTIPQPDVDVDGNGHGTHCAGTIASRKYGVAKGANVIAIKVLGSNGSGSMSDVVGGVVFAADSAVKKAKAAREEYAATGKTSHKGSVANMSLGGGKSKALDDAVNKAVKVGLHFAVAAGNDNRDACSYSPAAAELAVTVGASTLGDERAYFSNHGECVDVFGPGLNILSTWTGSETATNTISGTSMASPHVCGLLAYLLSVYPTKSFNPAFGAEFMAPTLGAQHSFQGPVASTYALVRASLPRWISTFLPTPELLEAVQGDDAQGPPTLNPAQLKKALLGLATVGVLTDLPGKTPNLLIFNNATSS